MAKRPVPLYDFAAFGQAIKAARTARKESRKDVKRRNEIFLRVTLPILKIRDKTYKHNYHGKQALLFTVLPSLPNHET